MSKMSNDKTMLGYMQIHEDLNDEMFVEDSVY